ncbi:MAG: hypothetical protein UT04_C0028G0001, partial [Candidatus Daviesbacteria bacterium GW2011_GWF2_38_7]
QDDMRKEFFGAEASTAWNRNRLQEITNNGRGSGINTLKYLQRFLV